jgi:hypothetical protein
MRPQRANLKALLPLPQRGLHEETAMHASPGLQRLNIAAVGVDRPARSDEHKSACRVQKCYTQSHHKLCNVQRIADRTPPDLRIELPTGLSLSRSAPSGAQMPAPVCLRLLSQALSPFQRSAISGSGAQVSRRQRFLKFIPVHPQALIGLNRSSRLTVCRRTRVSSQHAAGPIAPPPFPGVLSASTASVHRVALVALRKAADCCRDGPPAPRASPRC